MMNKEPQMFYPWTEPKGIMNIQHIATGWMEIDQNYYNPTETKKIHNFDLFSIQLSQIFQS